MSISPAQCRAARGLADVTQADLAGASGVSLRTIAHFESGTRNPIPANLAALKAALEAAGVVFIDENGGGPGVRMKKAKKKAKR